MDQDQLIIGLSGCALGISSLLLFSRLRLKLYPIRKPVEAPHLDLYLDKLLVRDQTLGLLPPQLLTPPRLFPNPILGSGVKTDTTLGTMFMPPSLFPKLEGYVNANSAFSPDYLQGRPIYLVKSAPKSRIVMDPSSVKAAIVTCGGICPGLNVVIRELVMSLHYNYGATHISGILNGYKGFYTENSIRRLSPESVSDIHNKGGTILKSSRGGWDLDKIANSIEANGFNQIYIIGGDGTHRGINYLVQELQRRNLLASVVGVPKTIDNDIPIIDKSFGFESSVEEAQRAIDSADVEANSVENGVGLVKLMGRNSGFIALHAALSNRNVNLCLIPEIEYNLNGENGVYRYVSNRLRQRGHIVIVVAEGAAVGCKDEKLMVEGKDQSGNNALFDIGNHLKEGIIRHCKQEGIDATLKYIDPSYLVRTAPINASDKMLCTVLAQAAVNGAFAGFTGFSVGTVAGQVVYIPVGLITSIHEGKGSIPGQRKVDVDNNMLWWRLMASTGQPSFRS